MESSGGRHGRRTEYKTCRDSGVSAEPGRRAVAARLQLVAAVSRVRTHVVHRHRHGLVPEAVAAAPVSSAGRASAADLDPRPPSAARRRLSGRGPASLTRATGPRAALRSGALLHQSALPGVAHQCPSSSADVQM